MYQTACEERRCDSAGICSGRLAAGVMAAAPRLPQTVCDRGSPNCLVLAPASVPASVPPPLGVVGGQRAASARSGYELAGR